MVTLQWTPPSPEDQNGEIGYHLNVTEVNNKGNFFQLTTASPSMVLRSLRPFTQYEIRIAAYTVVGDGPYSSPINVMTKEAGTHIIYLYNHCSTIYTLFTIYIQLLVAPQEEYL